MSQAKAVAFPPSVAITAAVRSAAARLMSNTATTAPSAAKRRQVAPPIPPPPPVTMTVFPLSPRMSRSHDRFSNHRVTTRQLCVNILLYYVTAEKPSGRVTGKRIFHCNRHLRGDCPVSLAAGESSRRAIAISALDAARTALSALLFRRIVTRLEALQENTRRVMDMLAVQRFGFLAIAIDDGIHDRVVFVPDDPRHLFVVLQHLAHHATQTVPVRRGGFTDQRIAREFA